ncbi:protein TAMALIN-like [Branchiostoma floridae x Branchiostoma belcheri]
MSSNIKDTLVLVMQRKLVLNRIRGEPFGFELQTYGIHHRGRQELELCTYVSRVYDDSPAFYCGLTPGDVILSVNDVSVAHADHEVVVKHVREAGDKLSLIVLFENCIKKVELEVKLLRLKRLLFDKELELRALLMKEKQILKELFQRFPCQIHLTPRPQYPARQDTCALITSVITEGCIQEKPV